MQTRGSCAEKRSLPPDRKVATREVSPEEERRDGHKEGRTGRECQIWGMDEHRGKANEKTSGVALPPSSIQRRRATCETR